MSIKRITGGVRAPKAQQRKADKLLSALQSQLSQEEFAKLNVAQRWELVRRVLLVLVRNAHR